jgi:septum formation protein
MSAPGPRLVLASASPRRREILAGLGLTFDVVVSGADEARHRGEPGAAYAQRVAIAKAREISTGRADVPYVLGADTIVEIDGDVLGKPESDAAGRAMLERLAGRWHAVTTAIALMRGSELLGSRVVGTRVNMRAASAGAIARYVATGEGRDKAGGYAIQGIAGGLVVAIEGSYSNVVGLPAAETIQLLEEHGAIGPWPSAPAPS